MHLSLFQEDPSKQRDGSPVCYPSPSGEITFYLRRWGTKESEKIVKQIRRELFGPLHRHTESDQNEIYAHWLVEYGIANWKGLRDDKTDIDIEYTKDNARSLFLDKSYWLSLNQLLIEAALNFEHYLFDDAQEVIETIKKP